MADNTVLNAGTGGDTIASDDIAGVKHQRVKISQGADGSATDVSSAAPLNVTVANTGANATAIKVDGSAVTQPVSLASLPASTNTLEVVGDVAQDAAVAGNPVLAGARASAAAPTDMSADGDSVYLWATLKGALNVADAGGTLSVDDGAGNLSIDDGGNSITVDNGGTFAVQATVAAAATNIAKAEDVASADADVGVPALAVRKATPANTSGTDGDYEFLQMSAGRLWASATIDAALPAGTNAIGKLAANSGVDIGDVDVTSIAAGDNNIGNVDIVTMPNVTLAAGTNTNEVVGDAAHDAAIAGNPVRVGARADTALSGITLVADGDTTDLYAGVDGVLIVREHCNLEDVVQERTTNTDGASTAFASGLAAPGAGIRLWITGVDLCNSSASFITVDLRDGSAGSVLWTLPVPATGGVVKTFNPPLKLTANTALAFDASAATTTLTISANGFKSKL